LNDELFTSITVDTLLSEFPGYLGELMPRIFVEHLVDTQEEIKIKIREAAKDDESEVARISRAVYVNVFKATETVEEGEVIENTWLLDYAKYRHEEFSIVEFNLTVRSIFLEVHEIVAKYFYLPPWKHQYT
jgi:hypothetical protein